MQNDLKNVNGRHFHLSVFFHFLTDPLCNSTRHVTPAALADNIAEAIQTCHCVSS